METQPYYIHCLRTELDRRCRRNPNYSLRTFARSLDLDPGVLSRMMKGQRRPRPDTTQKIIERLNLAPGEATQFLSSSLGSIGGNSDNAGAATAQSATTQFTTIDQEMFRVISDLYHYAILELTYVEDFQAKPAWIAKKLNISVTQAQLAIERMKNLGLLVEEDGRLEKRDKLITTSNKRASSSGLRQHMKQVLEKATIALEELPIEKRVMSSMTLPINSDKVELARELIDEFLENFTKKMKTGNRNSVYQTSICFYPLTED